MKIFFKINFNKIYNAKNIIYLYKLIINKFTYNVTILHNVNTLYNITKFFFLKLCV
jgi:hypothetical protein